LNYTISDIIGATQSVVLQQSNNEHIAHVIIDSRKLFFGHHTLFVCLYGPRRSGADFIEALYQDGVRNFMVDETFNLEMLKAFPAANFLQVKNTLHALQLLAAFHRNQYPYPVIGITGSNGKTIIKEWLYQLLHQDYQIIRSPKSYNSQIGVPLSILQMEASYNLGIFEAGISMQNEMSCLQKIIHTEIGILSHIGNAHQEGFNSIQQKIEEKLQLFSESKVLIYCSDDSLVKETVLAFKQKHPQLQLLDWGRNPDAYLSISSIVKGNNSTTIHCTHTNNAFQFDIPFIDDASIFNTLICCTTMLYLGYTLTKMSAAVQQLRSLEMRLELKQGVNQCTIINDSYSADWDSFLIALDFLALQIHHDKKTVILSDIAQTAMPATKLYKQIADALSVKKINRLIGIGPEICANAHLFAFIPQVEFHKSTSSFIDTIPVQAFYNETILVKGARIYQFEKILKLLEQKLHDTVLEVNLNAIRHNLKQYRQSLQKDVKLMAMVKAFSYGSGSYEIANLLQQEGVEYLAVAYTDEGVELRKAGVRLPIMVMNTTAADFDNIVTHQLEPELYSISIIHSFQQYLNNNQIATFPIHIKLDTGMHRLGFMNNEIETLCNFLKDNNAFRIQSVLSHLAASDAAIHDSFTLQQAKIFEEMCINIQHAVGYPFIKHLSNTSAIHRHPNLQYDMVRLGIGLYGVDVNMTLQNVTTLKTTIAQIKKLQASETVGYGRRGVLEKESIIATVRIGYADGYPRSLGNGRGKMLLNGALVPVIGSVCMDMTMIDITGVEANEGDEVIVFGEGLPITQLAEWADTISYEMLTNISQRVKRVYFEA